MKTGKVAKTVVTILALGALVVAFSLTRPKVGFCWYCEPRACIDSMECDYGCNCMAIGTENGVCVSIR